MNAVDLVEIRSAAERALTGTKVELPKIFVSGREPVRVEIELRGGPTGRDDRGVIARRVCSAVSRMVRGFSEIVVGWS